MFTLQLELGLKDKLSLSVETVVVPATTPPSIFILQPAALIGVSKVTKRVCVLEITTGDIVFLEVKSVETTFGIPVVVGVCGRVGALSAVTELLTILESLAIYEIKPKLELFDDGILSQVNTPTKKNRIIISLYSMGKYSNLRKQNVN
jgi:hypothetical protein